MNESSKIEGCLMLIPALSQLLDSKEFFTTICNGSPIPELSRLPAGVEVENLSNEGLNHFHNSNKSTKLNLKDAKAGILLKSFRRGSKDLITVFHVTYQQGNPANKLSGHVYNVYSIDKNTELNVQEKFFSTNGDFNNTVSHWVLNVAARVTKYSFGNINQKDSGSVVVNDEFVEQFSKSEYNSYPFYFSKNMSDFKGKIINNLNATLLGKLASYNINSISILSNSVCVENNIEITHAVEKCQSLQLFKGVYDDDSKAVFDSCVIVEKNAQKSNSVQKNNNILLSDKASVQSNPKLEIFADDVECAHGSTCGQIDESALFYLRSRGLSHKQSRSILLSAFLNDVVEKVGHQDVSEVVVKYINDQFSICE